ncbi:MAG: Unknown protein [uncultured Sulfurovum sp.]|uniref:asparagine synthase (glutamine-hydrolyzing) n=1 Tax=uncultured Sulfurovum sp. TaxID=269237 RepID=A0A6S6TDP4_9BACT|nr:MAG: Unknown protein [uncultured Sulfurovum sp.]
MIHSYHINNAEINIQSDLAAQFPIYIYLSTTKDYLLYTNKIEEIFQHPQVSIPLELREESLSFLLQSGIIPLPNTIYKNIFIVGIGDIATVKTIANKIKLSFSHDFPFKHQKRNIQANIDQKEVLNLLAKATESKLNKANPSYLFQSAGKDSNMIALSLAQAGEQNKITCLTYKGKNQNDESNISKEIAKKLGFKHQILYQPKHLERKHIQSINDYFENIPFPCVDNATLAYPLYNTQVEFQESNIIDGSGNDVYIGHIPNKDEYYKQKLLSNFHMFRTITDKLSSTNRLRNITHTKSEWAGLSGLSFSDTKKIFNSTQNVYHYWKKMDEQRKEWDYLDLRADIWGSFVESDRVIRKARNLAFINNAKLILPWCDTHVTHYFSTLPEHYLIDRKIFKNKLFLRKILKEKISLDSDKLGKKAFSFDFFSILMEMREEILNEIIYCKLWNQKEIKTFTTKLLQKSKNNQKSKIFLQRLYLISSWYNKNKYIKRVY